MHQMARDIVPQPEIQESKATFVQESLGYTFQELVQRVLADPVANQAVKANVRAGSKKVAIANVLDANCVVHPKYMTDKQQKTFLEGFEYEMASLRRFEEMEQRKANEEALRRQEEQINQRVEEEVQRRITPAAQ